jgi:CheY-like chemotaxis protein
MIILVAEENALSRELIRKLLEGSGQVGEKFGFQQIFWYRNTLTDLQAQRHPTFGINHNVAQTPI